MKRKLPIIPTILVALAVAAMIGLGIWQLERREEKEALLATLCRRGEPAADRLADACRPRSRCRCSARPPATACRWSASAPRPARIARASPAILIIADCRTGAEGPGMAVELGWSKDPNAGRAYRGGLVSGVIAPDKLSRMRLVAASAGTGPDGQRAAVARRSSPTII